MGILIQTSVISGKMQKLENQQNLEPFLIAEYKKSLQ